MKPVWGAINDHDRTAFDIHFFADSAGPSAESGYRDHPADYVHEISGAPNEAVARYVAQAGIDILVDLNGYSHQSRLALFMRRPAPVVAAWFGMYATTGIEAFDYTIADGAALPPEEERFCTERVLRVPPSYLAFRVLYPVPDVAPPPSLAVGGVTFGCLCSQYKITDEVIAAWAAILAGAPSSRLLLKNAALGDGSSRASLLARFARHGIAADRLRLDGPAEHAEFLATYDAIDVALDTFPYNGGTTTMEALWQGVPVLAFDGDRWASRTSRSLLVAAGLDDWCLPARDAYVARAMALANDPGTPRRLARLRAALRERLAASPACDSAGLARSLESHYRDMAGAAALL
jgi:predicted O-linked N-acetylglucosamine transferase (SPINDLY family)